MVNSYLAFVEMSEAPKEQPYDPSHDSASETFDYSADSFLSSSLSSVNDLKIQMQRLAQVIESNEVSGVGVNNPACFPSVVQPSVDEGTLCSSVSLVNTSVPARDSHVPQSTFCEFIESGGRIIKQIEETIDLLISTRRQSVLTLRDVQATMTELELSSREYLEQELDLWKCSTQSHVFAMHDSVTPVNAKRPLLEQTAVFELLERQTALSSEELERMKAEYENKLEHFADTVAALEQQLSQSRASSARLECELNKSNAFAAGLERELTTTRSNCDRLNQELSQADVDRRKLDEELRAMTASKQHAERELDTFTMTLQRVAEHYIPYQAFPLVRQPLTRIQHTLDSVTKLCPWLFSVLMDENTAPGTILPNPVSLALKQSMIVDKLTMERNSAEDKAFRANQEATEQRELVRELEDQLKQHKQQSLLDHAQMDKLQQRINRYRSYIRQFLDPNVAATVAAHFNNQSQGSRLDESGSSASADGGQHVPAVRYPNGETVRPSRPVIETPESLHQVTPKITTSATRSLASPVSVLSRVGSAVTAIAAAIVSPRRNPDVPRTSESAPSSVDATRLPALSSVSEDLKKNFSKHPSPIRDTFTNIAKDVPTSSCSQFKQPSIQPSWKRRPLDELPLPTVMDPVRESKPIAAQSTEWKIPAKVPALAKPSSAALKQTDFEAASFLHLDPLAESTSGPFRAPPEPAKRLRCEEPVVITKSELLRPSYAPKEVSSKPQPAFVHSSAVPRAQPKNPPSDNDECIIS